jgi:hypothetical protein
MYLIYTKILYHISVSTYIVKICKTNVRQCTVLLELTAVGGDMSLGTAKPAGVPITQNFVLYWTFL